MSDDVRRLLRLPRQWQLQVWRWVPFQPRSIGHFCHVCIGFMFVSTFVSELHNCKTPKSHTLISENCLALMCLCSFPSLHVLYLLKFQHTLQSWTGKWEPDGCHLQRCRGQASRYKQMRERSSPSSFSGNVTTSSCFSESSCHEFQCNPCHASGVVCCDKLSQFKASAGGPSRFDRVGAWHSTLHHFFVQWREYKRIG